MMDRKFGQESGDILAVSKLPTLLLRPMVRLFSRRNQG